MPRRPTISVPFAAMLTPMVLAIALLFVGAALYSGMISLPFGDMTKTLRVAAMAVGTLVILALAVVELSFYRYRAKELSLREDRLRTAVNELEMEEETKAEAMSGAMHDDIGGGLTALRMELELAKDSPDDPEAWSRCFDKVDHLLACARGIARTLYPKMVGELGLSAMIREMGDRLAQGGKFDVAYFLDPCLDDIPENLALCIRRIVQEALVNIARHSNGKRVEISIARKSGRINGSVCDDGTGHMECRDGLGITLMRERARYLGGVLNTQLTSRGGIEVLFDLPENGGTVA